MADFRKLTAYMDSLKDDYHIPGCDVVVWKDHRTVYRHPAGERHPGVSMNGTEFYNFYSASKISTMIASLKLIEEGKLSLADPLCKYLPAYTDMKYKGADGQIRPISRPITIEQCMTMTTGMDYEIMPPAVQRVVAKHGDAATTKQIVDAYAEKPLQFDPGTNFFYSLSHDVMGAVIEVVSGMKLGAYLQENVYDPLGITDITFYPTKAQEESMHRYVALEEKKAPQLKQDTFYIRESGIIPSASYESGGGGLVGTVESYGKIMDMLAGGGIGADGKRILKKETVEMCKVNHLNSNQILYGMRAQWPLKNTAYGWGLCGRVMIEPSMSRSPVGEFGWCGAAGCYGLADTQNCLAIFFGMNVLEYTNIIESQVHPAIRDMVYEALV